MKKVESDRCFEGLRRGKLKPKDWNIMKESGFCIVGRYDEVLDNEVNYC